MKNEWNKEEDHKKEKVREWNIEIKLEIMSL